MRKSAFWFLLFPLVSCSSGGTETDNPDAPLRGFTASGCKNQQTASTHQPLVEASDVDGLQCVSWERELDGRLRLRLANFPEPCGETYLGKALRAQDGALELTVYKDTCMVYRCGTCVFDFDFELAGIAADKPLPLRIGAASCASEGVTVTDTLTLPLAAEPSGTRCRYLARNVLEQYAREGSRCSQPNMPCGTPCDSNLDRTTCEVGLSCTSLGSNDERCLVNCSSDDECGAPSRCQDGTCQTAAGF